MNEKRTTDDLRAVGFQQIATWQSIGQGIGLKTDEVRQDEILALLTASNALYSFASATRCATSERPRVL